MTRFAIAALLALSGCTTQAPPPAHTPTFADLRPSSVSLVSAQEGWAVGWLGASVRLRVPEHIHLLLLSAYSPELQPAEHLWPLTNTVLANRHFATMDELEDAQADRCVAL